MKSLPFYFPCEYLAFRKEKGRARDREKAKPTYCDTSCFGLKVGVTYNEKGENVKKILLKCIIYLFLILLLYKQKSQHMWVTMK